MVASTSYFHYDGQGNVDSVSDESGAVKNKYRYTAFGETTTVQENVENNFKYVGELGYYSDSTTGENYVRARTYSPVQARWLSQDPIGFLGGLNLYGYVGGNPINAVDPFGLDEIELSGISSQSDVLLTVQVGTSLRDWTLNNARGITTLQRAAMLGDGNGFANRLHVAWLTGAGKYAPNAEDKKQVKNNSADFVNAAVKEYVDDKGFDAPGNCPKTIKLDDLTSKGFKPNAGKYDRAQWTPVSNINMFFAFGGASFDISGNLLRRRVRGWIDCECDYAGNVSVTFQDTYTFKPTGTGDYRLANIFYNAAHWLEKKGHAKPVSYEINFWKYVKLTVE